MNFFDNTVANLHWRGAELYHDTFATVQKYFLDTPIPYVNVRDQLGRLIGDIFEWAGDQPVVFDAQVSPKFEPFANLLFDALKDLIPEAAKYLANEKDSEDNAAVRKLLLKFKSGRKIRLFFLILCSTLSILKGFLFGWHSQFWS